MTGRPAAAAVALLVLSAAALVLAPLAMPDSYSWREHTTSESAAQGVAWSWLARTGFVLFGGAVLVLAIAVRRRWRRLAAGLHGAFGLLMVAAGAFSARSWEPTAPFDRTEDTLHSVAASAMGVAFAGGVVAVVVARRARIRPLDAIAVIASVAIPLAMTAWSDGSGALQRLMFAIAYAWYGLEARR